MKQTQGKWEAKSANLNPKDPIFYKADVICGGIRIAQVAGVGEEAANANAQLLAEAGTVANETGLTPRQLAERRTELLEVCEEVIILLTKDLKGVKVNASQVIAVNFVQIKVEQAIARK